MAFAERCYNCARGVGTFIGGSVKALTSVGQALRERLERLRPLSSIEKIRAVVIEELRRFMGKEPGLTSAALEERLQVMAEALLALQDRINELGTRGPISEAAMLEAMGSVKAAGSLTNNERAILLNVFRQNVALQKPQRVDDAVDQGIT